MGAGWVKARWLRELPGRSKSTAEVWRAGPAVIPAVQGAAPRPMRRENRAAHSLMPPLRLMNWSRGSESGL
jgi:hypothetical protein